MGNLWESFFIAERIKWNVFDKPSAEAKLVLNMPRRENDCCEETNHYARHFCNYYFWRTTLQQEIDLIEETDGKMTIFEMKWNPSKKASFPKTFLDAYPIEQKVVITPDNYLDYILT